jgi:hypothetical protein
LNEPSVFGNSKILSRDVFNELPNIALPEGAPPESASDDKMIIAIRIRESFVRMLTPAEIAVRSRSQPMCDE